MLPLDLRAAEIKFAEEKKILMAAFQKWRTSFERPRSANFQISIE
jgi:hypothetical protein